MRNGLIGDIKNEDIKTISVNYTEGYGYLLNYDYVNRKVSHSRWTETPDLYINYIIDNNGYNGPYMYANFFSVIKYATIFVLILPVILFIFYILRNWKHKG